LTAVSLGRCWHALSMGIEFIHARPVSYISVVFTLRD
jgi:hypothetical protein